MTVSTPRVLVVSDSRITRRVVEMTFADQPLQLIACASPADAVADWQTRAPAVVLADVAMMAADGLALARDLRTHPHGRRTALLLMAGADEPVDEHAVAEMRASAVLRKPLDSHQLVDAVRRALRAGRPEATAPGAPAPSGDAAASPAPPGDDVDVDDVAARVATRLAADDALRARLEAAWLERAQAAVEPMVAAALDRVVAAAVDAAAARLVGEVTPAIVQQAAHVAVREEIARLRGLARSA